MRRANSRGDAEKAVEAAAAAFGPWSRTSVRARARAPCHAAPRNAAPCLAVGGAEGLRQKDRRGVHEAQEGYVRRHLCRHLSRHLPRHVSDIVYRYVHGWVRRDRSARAGCCLCVNAYVEALVGVFDDD